MIKFKEHDGLLFKMLEEPVPLTPDAEMPCLTRLIQDDSRMGMFNRDTKPSRLSDFYLVARIVSNNIVVDEFMESDYNRFEIIGTPVAEGSAEWALYQMMQGRKVCCSDVAYNALSMGSTTNIGAYYIGDPIHGGYYCTVDTFLLESVKTGWRIYEEPKPLLADAGIGDIVKTNLGDWLQIVDTPCLRFGHDECHRTHDGLYWDECGVCDTDSTYRIVAVEPIATEGTKEWALQMMNLRKCVCHVKAPSIKYHRPTYYVKRVVRENCTDDMYDSAWMEGADPTGWQLYEPKEEPKQDKTHPAINGYNRYDYIPVDGIKMPKPEPKYKAGDYLEVDENGKIVHCYIVPKSEANQEISGLLYDISTPKRWVGCIYRNKPNTHIIRKLKPSEVIVNIGCLSGTVVHSVSEDCFLLARVNDPQHRACCIDMSMLDTPTSNLVESLLKAQMEEAQE